MKVQPIQLGDRRDRLGRPWRDLRISLTDRCNFRCPYCMPADRFGPGHRFLQPSALLADEEIERIVRVAVGLGVEKIRLTGGEPLLRPGLEGLIERLTRIEGIRDLALTTNGVHLARKAAGLRAAGLQRVTVSLDALDDETFGRMNGVGAGVEPVLRGIDAAAAVGLAPVKINVVVKRGANDGAIVPLARRFHGTGHTVRFIEYMDVGESNGWRREEVVPASEILARIDAELPLEPIDPVPGEVARRYRYRDGGGEIGLIASVTRPFCGDCVRARITADGLLYTCLFATRGHDLRSVLRGGAGDAELRRVLAGIWGAREDRYSELRERGVAAAAKPEMSRLGG